LGALRLLSVLSASTVVGLLAASAFAGGEPPAVSSPKQAAPAAPAVDEPPDAPAPPEEDELDHEHRARVDEILSHMTLREKVGQMLFLGFGGTVMDETIAAFLDEKKPGGVALFARNIKGTEQTVKLIRDVRTHDPGRGSPAAPGGIPMFVSVDQEGGNVVRIKRYVTVLPSAMALGAARDKDLAYRVGASLGRDLRLMGFNMNLAPVLDINSNPKNPVIGTRSFGEQPQLVADIGMAYMRGMQSEGISAVAKHFPGHGDTESDSHHALPVLQHDLDRLRSVELVPFKAAFSSGLDALMTAHISLPKIAEEPDMPATVSKNVLTGILRKELGYDGIVVTDGLEMAGIVDKYGSGEAAVRAVEAGADMVMVLWFPEKKNEVQRMLLDAVKTGRLSEARIDQSVRRILLTKARRGLFEEKLLGADEAVAELKKAKRSVVSEAAARGLTLVRNKDGVLPLKKVRADGKPLRVLAASTEPTFIKELDKRVKGAKTLKLKNAPTKSRAVQDAQRIARLAKGMDVVVLGVLDGHTIRTVAETKKLLPDMPVVVVNFGSPYLLERFGDVDAYLCAFGFRWASERAAAMAVAGDLTPTGKLPVTLSSEHRYGHFLTYQALASTADEVRLAQP
jgi:beta-N-acetylhexosaminidase